MSLFATYSAENYEFILTPAGYIALIVIMLLAFSGIFFFRGSSQKQIKTKQLVVSALAMGLAVVASYLKLAHLPFGGSITLFSMFFICFIGTLYGTRIGILAAVAYGLLQLILDPYIYTPVQMLLDYPIAFGALGLSGIFSNKKHGLVLGYVTGVIGRLIFHIISGYIFFASFAPEGMNPFVYTVGYNASYIIPELIATVIVISIPAVSSGLLQIKKMAFE